MVKYLIIVLTVVSTKSNPKFGGKLKYFVCFLKTCSIFSYMYAGGCVHMRVDACRGQRHPYPGAGVISSCVYAGRTANALNWAIAPEPCFLILEPSW